MKTDAAKKLLAKLDASVGHAIIASLSEDEETIEFCSEYTGSHTLSVADSDARRVKAHWAGFIANQPKGAQGIAPEEV